MSTDDRFPPDFLWGAATSAYQIEGSPLEDGAGPSIWHAFSHTPGRIADGSTGDLACDHYRRFTQDVALMRELGLQSYRFSVSWSRVLPEGRGRVNQKGLDFYRRLVDSLTAAGIRPCVTLYHWDLPLALEQRGGWLNRDVAGWFGDYAALLYRALDDRVPLWATLNEPWVSVHEGYVRGTHAPGRANLAEAARAAHHLLLAHAAGIEAYRAEGAHQVGLVVNLEPKDSASDREQDREATARADAYMNRQFLDPLFLGRYPEELPGIYGEGWVQPDDEDLKRISRPVDFLGINYYSRSVVRHDPAGVPERAGRVRQDASLHTAMDWEVYPVGLTRILAWVTERYGPVPLYVTENGAAFPDPPPAAGRVADPLRTAYLREHLRAALDAIRAGVDLRGYFAWSLLDNFEWAFGYEKRFGLVHVDHATQARTLKDSARSYSEVIRNGGV